jgi:hypothetical protein
VQWLSVEANTYDDRAFVEWRTASEINTSHFVVEGSDDGEQFTRIGEVKAEGNSLNSYALLDPYWNSGTTQRLYRVISVDNDGAQDVSQIVKLTRSIAEEDVELYPNPSNGSFALQITNSTLPDLLEVYDASGKLVVSESSIQRNTEFNGFAQGVYMLRLQFGSEIVFRKVVVY